MYDLNSGKSEELYNAERNHVMQDLITTDNNVFWVEIFMDNNSYIWEILQYNIASKIVNVVQQDIVGVDSIREPVLTLSENGILWDIIEPEGNLKSYIYLFETNDLIVKQTSDINYSNPYIGNRLHNGDFIYLSGGNNTYEIKKEESILYEITDCSVWIIVFLTMESFG